MDTTWNMKWKLGSYSGSEGVGFQKIRGTFSEFPIIRIITSWGSAYLRKLLKPYKATKQTFKTRAWSVKFGKVGVGVLAIAGAWARCRVQGLELFEASLVAISRVVRYAPKGTMTTSFYIHKSPWP